MVALADEKIYMVPVYRFRPDNPIQQVVVDEWLGPTIAGLGPWYISDMRVASAPRITWRDAEGRKRVLPISRAVAFIARGAKDGSLVGVVPTAQLLWEISEKCSSHVGFRNRNPFDCRISNLMLGPHSLFVSLPSYEPHSSISSEPLIFDKQQSNLGSTDPLAGLPPFSDPAFAARSGTILEVRKLLSSKEE